MPSLVAASRSREKACRGIDGANLAEKTCPHFPTWLAEVVEKCSSNAQSWVYHHDIKLHKLESWEEYPLTGKDLLEKLLSMQRETHFQGDDSLVLIGHKLGCYILKKALVEAYHRRPETEEKQLLDIIESVMIVGEPQLDPKKPGEWIDTITECIRHKKCTKKLSEVLTVDCLPYISEAFEKVLLLSTSVEVYGNSKPQPRRLFNLKKRINHDGCIGSARVYVRVGTTASEEVALELGPGDADCCPFHPKSAHSGNLFKYNIPPALAPPPPPQAVQVDSELLQPYQIESTMTDEDNSIHIEAMGDASQNVIDSPNIGVNEFPETRIKISSRSDRKVTDETHNITPIQRVQTVKEGEENGDIDTNLQQRKIDLGSSHSKRDPRRKRNSFFSASIPPRDASFFDRPSYMFQLVDQIRKTNDDSLSSTTVARNRPEILWLVGVDGVGKSSIAKEFVYRHAQSFEFVIWLNASSADKLGSYTHDCAVALGLVNGRLSQHHDNSREKLMEHLRVSKRQWLLVLDDADGEADISSYIPETGTGLAIVTGRQKTATLSDEFLQNEVVVDGLTEAEALQFLKFLGCPVQLGNNGVVEDLTIRYHHSLFHLRLLADWSFRNDLPYEKMYDKESRNSLSQLIEIDTCADFRLNHTDELVLTAIQTLGNHETSLLRILSFLSGIPISKKVLLQLSPGISTDSERNLMTNVARLWDSGLLEIDGESQTVSVCKPIQVGIVLYDNDDKRGWLVDFHSAAMYLLSQWPSRRKYSNIMTGFWEDFESLHCQVNHMAQSFRFRCNYSRALEDPGPEFKQLLLNHTWYNSRRGNRREDKNLGIMADFICTFPRTTKRSISYPNMPLRCLSVRGPILRLVETKGFCEPFVTCSWSWANTSKKSVELTHLSVQEYMEGIEVDTLPQNLQDAIAITRLIGVDYLWTNDFCVDQADPLEIADELKNALDYYSNCVVNISTLKIDDSMLELKGAGQKLDIAGYRIYRSEGLAATLSAPWWKRVWSIQEQIQSSESPSLQQLQLDQILKRIRRLPPPRAVSDESNPVVDPLPLANGSTETFYDAASSVDLFPKPATDNHRGLDSTESSLSQATNLASHSKQMRGADDIPCAQAMATLEQGQSQLLACSFVAASASLVLSREQLRMAGLESSAQALDNYMLASAMLGTAYLQLNLAELALSIMQAAEIVFFQSPAEEQGKCYGYGRLLLSMASVLSSLERSKEAKEKLEQSRSHLEQDTKPESEWMACIDIRLADYHAQQNDYKVAHKLLKSSMEFFESQTVSTPITEAHWARIEFRRCLLYKAEGNWRRYNSTLASARAALQDFVTSLPGEDRLKNLDLDIEGDLKQREFDQFLEPWHW